MIYIIDHGFSHINPGHTVTREPSAGDNGYSMYTIIRDIAPEGWMHLIDVGPQPTESDILSALDEVERHHWPSGVICTSLQWPDSPSIRDRLAALISQYDIIVSAGNLGNSGHSFGDCIPHSLAGVTVVGSLNKSNLPASHNNHGDIHAYAPGTNICVNEFLRSGSEIAMAIYVAFFTYVRDHSHTKQIVADEFYKLTTHRFQCNVLRYNYVAGAGIVPIIEYINMSVPSIRFPTIKIYPSNIACDILNHEQNLRDHLRRNMKIILNAYPEGFYQVGDHQEFLARVFAEEHRDLSDLLIITGSMDTQRIQSSPLADNYVWGPFISHWITGFQRLAYGDDLEHHTQKKTHTFMCLNRVLRPHRLAVTAEMISRGLMESNYVSFSGSTARQQCYYHSCDGNPALSQEQVDEYLNIIGDRDYFVDPIDFKQNQATTMPPVDFYQSSFFSLVTETFFYENDLFPSEKIYKAIFYRHPFILVGSKGMLQCLKNQGFRTYDRWFDESYDQIANNNQRLQAIMAEVERISALPYDVKCAMFDEMREIAEHNRQILMDPNFIQNNSNMEKVTEFVLREPHYDTTNKPDHTLINTHSLKTPGLNVLVSGYQSPEEITQIVADNLEKTVLIDFTKEYVNPEIFKALAELNHDLSNVVITANPTRVHADPSEQQCIKQGLTVNYENHFVNVKHIYRPRRNTSRLPRRVYTLYGGKSRDYRTALVGLLSHDDLLDHGYVSYFGDPPNHFSEHSMDDFYRSDAPEPLKEKVKAGLDKITLPLVLDVPVFTWEQSHTLEYDDSYYRASDFVVVTETHDLGCEERVPLITEKSMKPLNVGKPMMIYGATGQTAACRKALMKIESWNAPHWDNMLGWVPYAQYDQIPDRWQRLLAFYSELERQIRSKIR